MLLLQLILSDDHCQITFPLAPFKDKPNGVPFTQMVCVAGETVPATGPAVTEMVCTAEYGVDVHGGLVNLARIYFAVVMVPVALTMADPCNVGEVPPGLMLVYGPAELLDHSHWMVPVYPERVILAGVVPAQMV